MENTAVQEKRKEKYELALKKFLSGIEDNPDIIGIFASGSFAYGRIDKHSDIDVYIILKADCEYRERGNTWIGGVEIEYFYNPPQQVRAYFKQEGNEPHTAHILCHGRLCLRRDPIIMELVQEAEEILDRKIEGPNDIRKEFLKYGLDDKRKDYWDCVDRGDMAGARLLAGELVEMCIKIHFQLKGQYPRKKKGLLEFLQKDDPEFERYLRAAIEGTCSDMDEKCLLALVSHIEDRLGGARSREWKMRTGLDLG